jgi:hypothetical protein
MKRKFKVVIVPLLIVAVISLIGCNEAERVSSNISKEADNFNVVRQLTVINNFTDTIELQMIGKLSIYHEAATGQLEITVRDDDGTYKKHFVGMSKFTTYVVEDVTGSNVSTSKYSLNFNPDMILPFDFKNRNEDGSK